MYSLTMYLNEQVDGKLTLHVDDAPVLEITAYDDTGVAIPAGFVALLVVRRNDKRSVDEIDIAEIVEATPDDDNIYYFDLSDITFERGNYEAHLLLNGYDTTPLFPTPVDAVYSYESFEIEVLE